MANTFPEKLDKINYDDLKSGVQQLESYIRYMCERTDFAVANITKVAAKAGNIGADVVILMQELEKTVSVLKSQVAGFSGSITGINNRLDEINDTIEKLDKRIAELEKAAATE